MAKLSKAFVFAITGLSVTFSISLSAIVTVAPTSWFFMTLPPVPMVEPLIEHGLQTSRNCWIYHLVSQAE